MKLTILIPVYNEERTIGKVLEEVISVPLSCQKEIIIIDDGSTDGTRQQITLRLGSGQTKNKKQNKLILISHKKNLGKGAAIRSGIAKATGDYILIQDADFEYKPQEIPTLLNVLLERKGLIAIYGSRFTKKDTIIPLTYKLGNLFLTWMTNILFKTNLSDMETGYKLLPTSFLKKNTPLANRFDMEPEITARLIRQKIPIVEVPISYEGRSHLSGKKLTAGDAIDAVKTLFRWKFFPAYRQRL